MRLLMAVSHRRSSVQDSAASSEVQAGSRPTIGVPPAPVVTDEGEKVPKVPPAKGTRARTIFIAGSLAAVLIWAGGISYVILVGLEAQRGETHTMSCEEFAGQASIDWRPGSMISEFSVLDKGDTLILRGEVDSVDTWGSWPYIGLYCGPHLWGLIVEGDVSRPFAKGDVIEVTLHVASTDDLDEEYYLQGEFILETLNEEMGWIGGAATVAPSAVSLISSGECEIDIRFAMGEDTDRTHWLLTVTRSPSYQWLNTTNLTLRKPTSEVDLGPVPLATFRGQEWNGVKLVQADPESWVLVEGNMLLFRKSVYSSGLTVEIEDYCGILYEGLLGG